jgi:hypothetical protein
MTTTTTTAEPIVLDVHICAQRRSYLVTFHGPDASTHAARFIEPRRSYCALELVSGDPTAEFWSIFDPQCEHGMSEQQCYGPGHYPMDNYR